MVKHSLSTKTSPSFPNRIRFFIAFVLLTVGVVGYRLFLLSFVRHDTYAQYAKRQQEIANAVLEGRGGIYAFDLAAREKRLLASNIKEDAETRRFYPKGVFASQVLGFVGYDGYNRVGQYGAEASFDDSLRAGDEIILTIDPQIQEYVENTLNSLLKKWSSSGGSIIVQEPFGGAIFAMASSPGFDPNNYSRFEFEDFINPATQRQFEPGSSFKPFTMAAALDSAVVTPDTTYDDTGAVTIGEYTIKNFNEKANGIQTMRQVLEKSLNTGTIFAQRRTGDDDFLNYLVGFGFGHKTGFDLAGEASGNISNLYESRSINFATASFGQGIAVTPLQLVNAFSAIANGGKLMKPYIVKEIIRKDGAVTETKPQVIRASISEKTSNQLRSILTDVVDIGFDKARVAGYDIAGKTGTAQIPAQGGGYLDNGQFIHNFVGFAPAYNPRFTILIKMDRPQGITFAADSLSPVFGDLAGFLIRYFKIPPTR